MVEQTQPYRLIRSMKVKAPYRTALDRREGANPMPLFIAIPVIKESDYETFRREMGADLADTYDKWLELTQKHRSEGLRQGGTLVDVEIDYDQFKDFCAANGTPPNFKAMLDMAIKKIPG